MPTVDFYITEATTEQARLNLACKLAAKAYSAKKQVYIHCVDQASAEQCDALLWSFDDISFIPHSLAGTADANHAPITIGWQAPASNDAHILLHLHPDMPTETTHYERIIEIVTADPNCKKTCREHYKAYQAQDFPLKSRHA